MTQAQIIAAYGLVCVMFMGWMMWQDQRPKSALDWVLLFVLSVCLAGFFACVLAVVVFVGGVALGVVT